MHRSYRNYHKIAYLFNSFILRNIPKYRNSSVMCLFKNKIGPTLLLSATGLNNITIIEEDDVKDVNEVSNELEVDNFANQVKKACDLSEEKLKDLLQIIKLSLEKSCEDYRNCLEKQIELMKKGMKADPLSEYWDEMVKYRVEADNLKQDINKFTSLLDYVGQIIFNLNICQTLLDNIKETVPEIQQELITLKELCNEQMSLNKDLEKELLKLDRLYIMFTSKS